MSYGYPRGTGRQTKAGSCTWETKAVVPPALLPGLKTFRIAAYIYHCRWWIYSGMKQLIMSKVAAGRGCNQFITQPFCGLVYLGTKIGK